VRPVGVIAPDWPPRDTGRELQLTFDDGPEPVRSALAPILKEVSSRKIVSGFFVLGEEVSHSHSAIADIRGGGHVIGNHSWDHMMAGTGTLSDDQIYGEFERTHAEVKSTGYEMQHWRAPRGEAIKRIEGLIVRPSPPRRPIYRLTHCDWDADSKDALRSTKPQEMVESIEDDFRRNPGRKRWRLLFHVVPHTASALKTVLDHLATTGNRFVDFSQGT
jgi:peptidoglycan/xylan/chitin deacetylase (PgdA/CDA1 family)